MPDHFEEVLRDPALASGFEHQLALLGGLNALTSPHTFIDIRRSPNPGRYNITIRFCIWARPQNAADEGIVQFQYRFKWEPASGIFYSVLPQGPIKRRLCEEMRRIRELAQSAIDTDSADSTITCIDQPLMQQVRGRLRRLARKWPAQALILAEELGVDFVKPTPAQ